MLVARSLSGDNETVDAVEANDDCARGEAEVKAAESVAAAKFAESAVGEFILTVGGDRTRNEAARGDSGGVGKNEKEADAGGEQKAGTMPRVAAAGTFAMTLECANSTRAGSEERDDDVETEVLARALPAEKALVLELPIVEEA